MPSDHRTTVDHRLPSSAAEVVSTIAVAQDTQSTCLSVSSYSLHSQLPVGKLATVLYKQLDPVPVAYDGLIGVKGTFRVIGDGSHYQICGRVPTRS